MTMFFALLALGWSAARELEPEAELPFSGGNSLANVTSGDATAEGVRPFLLPLAVLLGGLGAPVEGRALQALRPREARAEAEPGLPVGRGGAMAVGGAPRAKQVVRAPWVREAKKATTLEESVAESVAEELLPEVPWVDAAVARRLIAFTDGDVEAAKQKLREGEAWREKYLAKWDKEWPLPDGKDLSRRAPDCRVIADGKDGRQMLYGSARNQIKGEAAEQWALAWERSVAGRPGDEKIDFIMDAHGYNGLINLDPRPSLRLVPAMDSYFAGRVQGFYILDFPRVAEAMWNLLKGQMPQKTVESVHFLRSNRPEDMKRLDELCGSPEQAQMLQELLKMNRVPHDEGQLNRRARTRAFTDAFLAQQREGEEPSGVQFPVKFGVMPSGGGPGEFARGIVNAPQRIARTIVGTVAEGVAVGAEQTAKVARRIADAQSGAPAPAPANR